jgi:hypothetical protein
MSTLASPIDRLRELGGSLWLDGEKVRYRVPFGNAEARQVVSDLRRDREAIAAMLRDQESKAPSLAEVTSMLPPGVRLVTYGPKEVPFAVAPVSEVSDAGKFYRAYLTDLRWRVENPSGRAAPPLADILGKLADAGLELTLGAG